MRATIQVKEKFTKKWMFELKINLNNLFFLIKINLK